MSILFLFLSLYVGINIRVSIVLGIIEAVFVIAFIFYRFSWKVGLISLGTLLIGLSISFIRPSFNKNVYDAVVIESKENYFIASSSLEKFYISEKDNRYEIGDIVSIKGSKKELDFNTVESGFDFKKYLNDKGIYSELVVTSINYKFENPLKIHKIKKEFLNKFDDNTKSVVSNILFGNSIDSETSNLFRDLHLIRLISNSGIFLYLIFNGLTKLLSKFNHKKVTDVIVIVLFVIYSLFTFPRFVVIKFLFLQFFKYINKYLLKNKFSYLEMISFLGIGFLIFDYHLAYQDSFLLAFLIPIFVLFYNGSFKRIKKTKKRILLSFLIAIMFVPFSLNYNNEISPLSIPFQIIFVPFTSIYGIMALFAFTGVPLYGGLNEYTSFLTKLLKGISPIFVKIYGPPFPTYLALIYEIVFFLIVYFLSIRFKEIYKKLIPLSLIIFSVYFIPIKRWIAPSVTFINVGQGDSCLISYKNKNILIDTGGSKYKDYATDCLIPFFKKQRIYTIDLLITTHDDIDHNGAAASLISNFKVNKYVTNYQNFPLYQDNLKIENLNIYPEIWDEDNDKSLVLLFSVHNWNFLITGDAPKKIENKIIENTNFTVDILKVGHHGSNTSTSDEFVKRIKPKEAIISCGKNNSYGHPHSATIDTLKKYKVKIRRTDYEGSIIYYPN